MPHLSSTLIFNFAPLVSMVIWNNKEAIPKYFLLQKKWRQKFKINSWYNSSLSFQRAKVKILMICIHYQFYPKNSTLNSDIVRRPQKLYEISTVFDATYHEISSNCCGLLLIYELQDRGGRTLISRGWLVMGWIIHGWYWHYRFSTRESKSLWCRIMIFMNSITRQFQNILVIQNWKLNK